MSAPFLRFGALFKDNAFLNDTLKLKILNDRKRVGTTVPLVPPAGNRTTASVCDRVPHSSRCGGHQRDEWVTRSHALAIVLSLGASIASATNL